jgi:hypothetical protein
MVRFADERKPHGSNLAHDVQGTAVQKIIEVGTDLHNTAWLFVNRRVGQGS